MTSSELSFTAAEDVGGWKGAGEPQVKSQNMNLVNQAQKGQSSVFTDCLLGCT